MVKEKVIVSKHLAESNEANGLKVIEVRKGEKR